MKPSSIDDVDDPVENGSIRPKYPVPPKPRIPKAKRAMQPRDPARQTLRKAQRAVFRPQGR